MAFALLVLALMQDQDADLEALIAQLDHDDPTVRERATKNLAGRGPAVVPRILSLFRSSSSAEVKSRSEAILGNFPFAAFSQTRPDEAIHDTLKRIVLRNLEAHQKTPGCWIENEKPPAIDGSKLRILWQTGSGHGQYLGIVQIVSRSQGVFAARRVAYQGTTPYRPQVKEESVRAEETQFDADDARALVALLQSAVVLRQVCAIEREPGSSWSSSASFSMLFRIESAGTTVWKAAFTGYPGSLHEKEYAHGSVLDDVLRAALAQRMWSEAKFLPEDRTLVLEWMSAHFASEGWWVREHYLNMARIIGDQNYLPFLRKVVKDLERMEDVSEKRQLKSAREALARIASAKD